jgi:SAM-dependent methyltransferase
MQDQTVRALDAVNERFYREHAHEFARTRELPWPGWSKLHELLPRRDRCSVLDLGCGNARLLASLSPNSLPAIDYLGLDRSVGLLRAAQWRLRRQHARGAVVAADLLPPTGHELPISDHGFDLVALMGVLHHIPGARRRAEVLRAAARRVGTSGLLAFSVWRFLDAPSLGPRALQGRDLAAVVPGADARDLEQGDALVLWGTANAAALRYCHHTDEAELGRLLELLAGEGLTLEERWLDTTARGFTNVYLALRQQ